MTRSFDVVAIGHALVDVIAPVDDAFLAEHGLAKGAMTLIEPARAEELYAAMPPAVEISGGSAANTAAGLASLGGRPAFIGKVCTDQLGDVFAHDIRAAGVHFATPPAGELATGRSLIFVTPDSHRTMQTSLGTAALVSPDDVDPTLIGAAAFIYLEGYLFDRPAAKQAFLTAAQQAAAAGCKVALTLSDAFCVERHRSDFLEFVRGHVDVLFANETEILALYETDDFGTVREVVSRDCEIAVLTRSEKGSEVVSQGEVHVVAAERSGEVVDTTGAGDLYAAGFLYGLTRGHDLATCGRIGALAAGEVISHVGARPERPLRNLVAERLASAPAAD